MDDVLKELKVIREDVETRLRKLLQEMDEKQGRFSRSAAEAKRVLDEASDSLPENTEQLSGILNRFVHLFNETHIFGLDTVEGLKESISLHNARSAELARQLTVLPLERMDLILDKFERRLESFECSLLRLEKKVNVLLENRSNQDKK